MEKRMSEEAKTEELPAQVTKKKRAPRVLVGDQADVEAGLQALYEEKQAHAPEAPVVAEPATVVVTHDDEGFSPAVRAEREAGRRAVSRHIKR